MDCLIFYLYLFMTMILVRFRQRQGRVELEPKGAILFPFHHFIFLPRPQRRGRVPVIGNKNCDAFQKKEHLALCLWPPNKRVSDCWTFHKKKNKAQSKDLAGGVVPFVTSQRENPTAVCHGTRFTASKISQRWTQSSQDQD